MAQQGATVWWIEANTGELRHKSFTSAPRLGFQTEVEFKHSTNPIEILVIHDRWAGDETTRQDLERLKEKAAQMRASKE